jgi:hypothetical protein
VEAIHGFEPTLVLPIDFRGVDRVLRGPLYDLRWDGWHMQDPYILKKLYILPQFVRLCGERRLLARPGRRGPSGRGPDGVMYVALRLHSVMPREMV